jgi:hypothetical protein
MGVFESYSFVIGWWLSGVSGYKTQSKARRGDPNTPSGGRGAVGSNHAK